MPTKKDMFEIADQLVYHYNDWTDRWEPIKPSISWPGLYTGIRSELRIEKVIFNEPATIVFWKDGTKTVVKCNPNDIFDPEKGIAMCFVKKIYGNKGRYNNVFKPWVDDYYKERVGTYEQYIATNFVEKVGFNMDTLGDSVKKLINGEKGE